MEVNEIGPRWMVYGKHVIMPKTGQPMREFFVLKEEAVNVAIVISGHMKGKLGLYFLPKGNPEDCDLIEEYDCGKQVMPWHGQQTQDYSAPAGCATIGSCMGPIIGILLSACAVGGLLLLLRVIVSALKG